MRRLRALDLGQRIVLVVALAAILRTVGGYTTARRAFSGWAGYVPLTDVYTYGGDPGWHPVPAALFWVALITVWAVASVWLLGSPRRSVE